MNIIPLKDLAKNAFVELNQIQIGKKKIVKTGEEMIDCHIGGLLPGDAILLSGGSGDGKSETLYRLKEKILSKEVNEEADEYIFLDMSLEMKIFNIVLRGIHRDLGKKKREILFKEFTEEERIKVDLYYKGLRDDRQFVVQAPATPLEFFEGCKKFLDQHIDKKAIFITIDHMLLMKGRDKGAMIEEMTEYINQIKLTYPNVYFILLSQLNRGILGRIAEKNNLAAPNASDVFQSSYMDFLVSYNIVLYNAYKKGIMEYMKVNPDRYDYLEEHFGEEDTKGRVSFDTVGKIFFHVIKTRESDTPYKNIFVKTMDIPQDQLEKMKTEKEESKKEQVSSSDLAAPVFETNNDIKPNHDMGVAFGDPEDTEEEDDNDGMPF